jgi:hypothetical protein
MLVAGVADRYNRRLILRCCYAIEFCMQARWPDFDFSQSASAIMSCFLVNAIARTFEQPVMQSLVPVMAPRVLLGRAIAAPVGGQAQISPSLGGILYVFGPDVDYGICTLLVLSAGRKLPVPTRRCSRAAEGHMGHAECRLPFHLAQSGRAGRDVVRPDRDARRQGHGALGLCATSSTSAHGAPAFCAARRR